MPILPRSAFSAARGLPDRFRRKWAFEGMIDPDDIDLVQIRHASKGVVDAIFNCHEKRDFEPSAREREILRNL